MTSPRKTSSLPLWVFKLSLLAAAAIWGLGTVVIKSTVDEFPPSWIVGIRFFGAGILLALVGLPSLKRALQTSPASHLGAGAILGVFLFFSYWCNTTGLTDTTASNSAFLTTFYVMIIPFLGWFLLKKQPTRYNIGAAFACLAGLACVAYGGEGTFSLRFGDLITLLSAVFLSLHVLYTAKLSPGHSVTVLTIVQFLVAGLMGIGSGLLLEPTPDFANLSQETWISLGYLTVFASCIALGLQNAAVARVDPAQASLFLSLEAVFGVLFSVMFLAETPTPTALLGFGLIFAAIVVSEYLPLQAQKRLEKEAQVAACEVPVSGKAAATTDGDGPAANEESYGVAPENLAAAEAAQLASEETQAAIEDAQALEQSDAFLR